MTTRDWHASTIERLTAFAEADPDVAGLVLFGSLAAPAVVADAWSDIDVMLVLREATMPRFFPSTEWLSKFGDLWAWEHSVKPHTNVVRACFEDLRRIDFVLFEASGTEAALSWPDNPFRGPRRVLVAKDPSITAAASAIDQPIPARPESIDALNLRLNAFLFEAHIAVKKAARGDHLIATHLALGLALSLLEVEMLLRDRDGATRYHKHGAASDAEALAAAVPALEQLVEGDIAGAVASIARRFKSEVESYEPTARVNIAPLEALIANDGAIS